MSILTAYKKLKKEVSRLSKIESGELFLCIASESLYSAGKITKQECLAIIEDIDDHLDATSSGTMHGCVLKTDLVDYSISTTIANQYRLAWLEMQIIRYSLTAE